MLSNSFTIVVCKSFENRTITDESKHSLKKSFQTYCNMMLKKLSLILFILIASEKICAQSLASLQWQNRILLLFADDESQAILQKQIAYYQKAKEGYFERDLVVCLVLKDKIKNLNNIQIQDNPHAIRKQYRVDYQNFTIILIGKDGTEKKRSNTLLENSELFAIIDAMPMRQTEKKGKH